MKEVGNKGNRKSDENIVELDALYKYGKFNEYTEKIFTNNEIYFSSPIEFNDPFDSKPHYICEGSKKQTENYLFKMYSMKYPEQSKKEIYTYVKEVIIKGRERDVLEEMLETSRERDEIRKKFGVCCFSEKRDNILMWAHYAEQHTGFCLVFDIENDFFRPIVRALKVKYNTNLPELNVMKLSNYSREELSDKLLTKANDWEYEQEWRIIEIENGPGIKNFPEEALSGVILGCRISQENKENLLSWCTNRKHSPTLYETKEKQKEFGLDISKIDY